MLLAEIADKMPTALETAAFASLLAASILALGMWRWWLVSLALPLSLWLNYGLYTAFSDPSFGLAIVTELGHDSMVGQVIAANLPFAVVLAVAARHPRRCRKPGHCPRCGYNLTGNITGRCPECGRPCIPHRQLAKK